MSSAAEANKYRKLNDVEVDSIIIRSDSGGAQDIKELVTGFNIYENIDGSYVTTTLDLIDNINFVNSFPVIGQETITIKFRTPGFGYEYTTIRADVMKLGKRSKSESGNSEYYQISCVSRDCLTFETTRLSQSYEGTASGFINEILKSSDSGGAATIVEHSNPTSIWVIPNYSKMKALKFLTSKCYNSRSRLADFFLFETTIGWMCRSLSSMQSAKPVITYRRALKSKDGSVMKDFTLIEDMQVLSEYNRHKEIKRGAHCGSLLTFNWTNKTSYYDVYSSSVVWMNRQFDRGNIEEYKTLPIKNRYDSNPGNKISIRHQSTAINGIDEKSLEHNVSRNEESRSNIVYNSNSVVRKYDHPNNYRKNLLTRRMSITNFNPQRVIIKVPGNSDMIVGSTVELMVPSAKSKKRIEKEQYDPLLSGKYIVTNVRHKVDLLRSREYTTYLELGRNASSLVVPDKNEFLGTGPEDDERGTETNRFGMRRT